MAAYREVHTRPLVETRVTTTSTIFLIQGQLSKVCFSGVRGIGDSNTGAFLTCPVATLT